MKLVTYDMGDFWSLGMVYGDRVADLDELSLAAGCDEDGEECFCCSSCFLEAGDRAIALARRLVDDAVSQGLQRDWPKLTELKLSPPIVEPRKILALAGNYRAHISEGGGPPADKAKMVPNVFIKPVTCVIGPGDPIRLPGPICTSVDYEGELGVVIGKACHYVKPQEALEYVGGYLIVNDVSGRKLNVDVPREVDARSAYFDWLNGKWFDTFAPMGPYLVLKDEVPDPHALDLTTRVNGQMRQHASTADMIFTVAETVAWVSQFVTLEPGDVIATGTPSGVGSTTGTYLKAGDVVEVEISGLGILRNPVEG